MNLLEKLNKYIETGEETPKIELKRELNLETKPNKAEFTKDILAIANTKGWYGYIIIGVLDKKHRTASDPSDYIVGFSANSDEFRCQIMDILSNYCEPVPTIEYQELSHPIGKKIGVVIIPRPTNRPYLIKRSGEGINDGDIFIRRGAATFKANRHEIDEMKGSANSVVIINFAHPITDAQRERVQQQTGSKIEDIINIETKFDLQRPLSSQIDALIESVPLTSEEWQTTPLIINIPGFSSAAVTLIADLHGRMGHFPTTLALRPVIGTPQRFEVAEVLNLQQIRDEARKSR